MPKFLSNNRASIMTEEQKYMYRIKDTIYETSEMKEQKVLNEEGFDAGPMIRSEIPPNADIFGWIGALLKKLLGLGLGLLGGAALLTAKGIIIRKLKNAMIKFVDWTEYGYHGKRGKGFGLGREGLGRYFVSEADKDRECYFSHEQSAERDILRITQQLMKTAGLTNLQ